MDADRWRRIGTVFAEALERGPEVRDAYLDDVCAGDLSMRVELDSLLQAHRENGAFLEGLTRGESRGDDDPAPSRLAAGTRLGAFEIVGPIGAGGMGIVYHARDTRLDRGVAIKILARRLDLLDASSERFEREARAISRLSHPHICTLYDIARAPLPPDDREVEFLVMERVKGQTLADVIAGGPLSLESALRYAIEVADALAHAHREGIVHRDLKPQNIMITPDGVKLLDFGLAAFTASAPHAPTTWPAIARVAGTAQYMAPEQIRGEEVDGRTDLFSLGLVLYEMLTGQRAFERPTIVETLHAILNESSSPLAESFPAEVRSIVRCCLEKDRDQRPQSASDLAAVFRTVVAATQPLDGYSRETSAIAAHRWRRLRARVLWSGLALLAIAVGVGWSWKEPTSLRVTGYTRLTNDGQQKIGGLVTDGPQLYLSERANNNDVVVRVSAAGGNPVALPLPFARPGLDDISADGSELLIGSYVGRGPFPYWRVPAAGGPPRRVGVLLAGDVHPSADGRRLAYVVESDMFVSSADGSGARRIASFPHKYPGNAAWAPDGRRIRFSLTDYRAGATSIWEVSPDGSGLQPILSGWNNPPAECCGRWTPDGRYFIFQAKQNGVTSLWALREPNGHWRRGAPLPVRLTEGPLHFRSPTPGRDGRTVFAIGDQVRGEIMRHDPRSGEWTPYTLGSKVRSMSEPSFSPDGTRVAYVDYPEGTLWCSKTDGTDDRQLTFPPMVAGWPSWAPDGQRLAFQARVAGGRWKIHVIPAAGGAPVQLTSSSESEAGADWAPDGRRIVFGGSPFFDPGTSGPKNLRVFDLTTRRTTDVPGSEGVWAARWSPDGRYLAAHRFDFTELRLLEVATGRWEILATGVLHFANWSRDSQYLFFESWGEDTAVIRTRIQDRKREKIGTLKEFRRTTGPERCWSGLTPDGSLLVLRDVGSQEIYALALEEN